RGQHLAFEPPMLAGATLGGVIGGNLSGPRRVAAGAARDHLLGFTGVNGRGEQFKSGGRVVKNVTGYDLSKLVAGSWGTLAALTEVALKVLPRPEETATLVLDGLDAAAAGRAMRAALASPHQISGAAWVPGQGTMLRLEGPAPSVAARTKDLATVLGQFGAPRVLDREETLVAWAAIRDVAAFADLSEAVIWRVSAPPASGPGVVMAIPVTRAIMDWGGGLVWLAMPPSDDGGATLVRGALRDCGGHATLVRAPEAVRATVPPFEPPAEPLAGLVRRVKESFDPLRLFNRGRLYQGL
ncbi:MAG TPA: 2-hydroxy-acid oxidase, partial [Stellaceae bacterium]|nr:2-hydroxy-acid oxidase [Stellaceae bacterium]